MADTVSDHDGWEARMAARAAVRRAEREAEEHDTSVRRWQAARGRELVRIASELTVGEMLTRRAWIETFGPVGCACPGPPDCCMDVAYVEQHLQRALHIVAKLLTDAAAPAATAH